MKKSLLLCLIFAMLLPCVPSAAYEGSGFNTPEDAAREYLMGLKELDLDKMLSTFAIETYVEHYDLDANLSRMKAYIPSTEIRFPNTNDLYRAMNVETRKNALVNTIYPQLFALNLPAMKMDGALIILEDGEQRAALLSLMNVRPLSIESIQVGDFLSLDLLNDHYTSEKNQENMQNMAAIYGADELKSLFACFTTADGGYGLCVDALRYGDRWYLSSLIGNLGTLMGVSSSEGGIVKLH